MNGLEALVLLKTAEPGIQRRIVFNHGRLTLISDFVGDNGRCDEASTWEPIFFNDPNEIPEFFKQWIPMLPVKIQKLFKEWAESQP
jgi:hypothetical protein